MRVECIKEVKELNRELKKVRDLDQLKILLKKAGQETRYGPYHLCGKRRGYRAYEFTPYPPNPKKTHYLYSDSISTGVSGYENLYRHLEFRE